MKWKQEGVKENGRGGSQHRLFGSREKEDFGAKA